MNNLTYESTDKLIKMYDDLTQYALDDIVERIVQNEVITGTAEYRIWKLQQIGIHLEKIKAYIKRMTKYSDEEIENIFKNAGFTLYRPITKLFIEQNTNFSFKYQRIDNHFKSCIIEKWFGKFIAILNHKKLKGGFCEIFCIQ